MTYADLARIIKSMPKEKQKQDVTVFDARDDEYRPVFSVEEEEEDDVLEKGHPFLVIE